jgi:hypothetical protein
MDTIVALALVGTAKHNTLDITTDTPVDALMEQLSVDEIERKLLLSAGAWGIHRQAGQVPEAIPTPAKVAPAESLAACSPEIAKLVESMLKGEHDELLPEAMERMQRAGLRLPYELLPVALGMQSKEIRATLFPVLGERGLWLSRFNPSWSWVAQFLPQGSLPADAETTWQEGTPGQRLAILRLLRASGPAKARDWLLAVWKQEKAESRAALLGTFEVGLSADDEELLEKALDDRAAGVRSIAPTLLARIPASAFAARMRTHADAMLSHSKKVLTVTPPADIDKDKVWQRDGIVVKPAYSGVGERAWWMTQVLSFVPPTYWEERFGMTPTKLIDAVPGEWRNGVIEGWARAALLHESSGWILPLWDWWCNPKRNKIAYGNVVYEIRQELAKRIPQQVAEQQALELKQTSSDWSSAIAELPRPWSKDFGDNYLENLRAYIGSLTITTRSYPYNDPWYQSLEVAAMALPPACFAAALEPAIVLKAEEDDKTTNNLSWQIQYWNTELTKFSEVLRIRQHLIEEMA